MEEQRDLDKQGGHSAVESSESSIDVSVRTESEE